MASQNGAPTSTLNGHHEDIIDVAIIGGGIAGLAMAIGLTSRNANLRVRVYERASSFREIGTGLGFPPNGEAAMRAVDTRIHETYRQVSFPNASDWLLYVDGMHDAGRPTEEAAESEEPVLFRISPGKGTFQGCARAQLLKGMLEVLPEGVVVMGKALREVEDRGDEAKLVLRFGDGSMAEADVVLGCDGLHSRVRQLILGQHNPASKPSYTHKYSLRGLIPMDRITSLVGTEKPLHRTWHLGLGAHAVTYPVAGGSLLNVNGMITDSSPWPEGADTTAEATREEAAAAFRELGPVTRAIIGCLPEQLNKWALFDHAENPAETYIGVGGRVCVMGDAAHAAAPHMGEGAGFAFEDAAVLCNLLDSAAAEINDIKTSNGHSRSEILRAALASYEATRYKRTQWLVLVSRRMGEVQQGQDAEVGSDYERRHDLLKEWYHKAWFYDVDAMLRQASEEFESRLAGETNARDGGMNTPSLDIVSQ